MLVEFNFEIGANTSSTPISSFDMGQFNSE